MSRNPILPVRMWRLGPWNANPLMRGSDRIAGVLRVLLIAVMLVMVPVAGAVGTARYTAATERIRSENAAKVEVTATLLAKPTAAPTHSTYRKADLEAPVQWSRNGQTGTATVTVADTANIGDQMRVWLGPQGTPTDPPQPPAAAVSAGIGAGVAVLLLAWLTGFAVTWTVDWLLEIRRNAQWDSEWRRIGRPIGT